MTKLRLSCYLNIYWVLQHQAIFNTKDVFLKKMYTTRQVIWRLVRLRFWIGTSQLRDESPKSTTTHFSSHYSLITLTFVPSRLRSPLFCFHCSTIVSSPMICTSFGILSLSPLDWLLTVKEPVPTLPAHFLLSDDKQISLMNFSENWCHLIVRSE